jgi:hypothetical protein
MLSIRNPLNINNLNFYCIISVKGIRILVPTAELDIKNRLRIAELRKSLDY